MKQQIVQPSVVPTAHIAINKSRLKQYKQEPNTTSVYHLKNGSEFQIELNNPTRKTILAKIQIDGKQISQGGLVLKPGERVFLERYMDVAKKFLFETYEVSNTSEVRNAIQDNGGIKIQFFNELEPQPNYLFNGTTTTTVGHSTLTIHPSNYMGGNYTNSAYVNTMGSSSNNLYNISGSNNLYNTSNYSSNLSEVSMDFLSQDFSRTKGRSLDQQLKADSGHNTKSIETGRVEKGSDSNQKITQVNLTFEFNSFHHLELKILPLSQKINTIEDLQVKIYCTGCATKIKPNWKFCPTCSSKI